MSWAEVNPNTANPKPCIGYGISVPSVDTTRETAFVLTLSDHLIRHIYRDLWYQLILERFKSVRYPLGLTLDVPVVA